MPTRHHDIALRRFAGPTTFVQAGTSLRIAQLTDLHVGRVTPMAVQRAAVDAALSSDPDIVVITGDFVCHSQAYLQDLAEVLSWIDKPVFCVMGNHDHWCGGQAVRKTLLKAGAEVLDNANTTITLGSERLQILGLDDAYTGHADRRKALRGLRDDLPTLGLSHIAEEADALFAAGVPLVLSGHTHGGQVALGLEDFMVGTLVGHRYVQGLYGTRHDDTPYGAVYVSAGIGAAVMPLRVGERGRREVAVFELGTEPGEFAEPLAIRKPLRGRKPSARTRRRREMSVERHQRWKRNR